MCELKYEKPDRTLLLSMIMISDCRDLGPHHFISPPVHTTSISIVASVGVSVYSGEALSREEVGK